MSALRYQNTTPITFIDEEKLKLCPFCGSRKNVHDFGDLYEFQCSSDSPCFGYGIKIFCEPSEYLFAIENFNLRPLEVRARMTALNEAAAVAANWTGRKVDASYAIKRGILDLKRVAL